MSEQSYKKLSYSESEIEELFLQVFMPLNFTDEVVKWMQGILLEQHREASKCHMQHLGALQGRLKMLENYIDKAYEDKLTGSISEQMGREKNQKWQLERETVLAQISSINGDKDDYI
jgi:hypothetical protein